MNNYRNYYRTFRYDWRFSRFNAALLPLDRILR